MANYNNFYDHWKDLQLLTCILAMIGLILAIFDYELTYKNRANPQEQFALDRLIIQYIVIVMTVLTILSVFFKELTAQVWYDFRDPILFYKTQMLEQRERNVIKPEEAAAMTDNYTTHRSSLFVRVIGSGTFIFETILLLFIPYPLRYVNGKPDSFNMYTVDFEGNHNCYREYTMYMDDLLFFLMFVRVYFLINALSLLAPMN